MIVWAIRRVIDAIVTDTTYNDIMSHLKEVASQ